MLEWLNSHANLPAIGAFVLIAVGVFFLVRTIGMLIRLLICFAIIGAGAFFFYKYTHTPEQTAQVIQKTDATLQDQADKLQQEINAKVAAKTAAIKESVGHTIEGAIRTTVEKSVKDSVQTQKQSAPTLDKATQDAIKRRLPQ